MTNEAFNKIQQTHPLFKKVTSNLNKLLGISFGYMKVFKDGSYYKIMDDFDCLTKFVLNAEKSGIFCDRNVTNCFDEYNFTLWPNKPISHAMKIYHEHNIWNGITVSKIGNQYTEIYFFTKERAEADWHKFFIRNKQLLLEFIDYFETQKEALYLTKNNILQGLFKFSQGFDVDLPKSEYIKTELLIIKKFRSSLDPDSLLINNSQPVALSAREAEVLKIICHGFTVKDISHKLNISVKTVSTYIERIKHKTGLHFKTELIEFYEKNLHRTS